MQERRVLVMKRGMKGKRILAAASAAFLAAT
jgi:hypothetical protein